MSVAAQKFQAWAPVQLAYVVKGETERRRGTVVRINRKSVSVVWQGGPLDGVLERVPASLLESVPAP